MDERTAAMPPNMELEVKIYPQQQSGGNVLANASVTINGCFAVKGIRVMNGSRGPLCFHAQLQDREWVQGRLLPLHQGVQAGV